MPAAASSRSRLRSCVVRCVLVLAGFGGSWARGDVPTLSASRAEHIVDFTRFAGQRIETNGPVDLGFGVIWSATHDGWLGDMSFGLRANGYWDAGRLGFAGLNIENGSMLFQFAAPIGRVGAMVNYAPYGGQGPIPTIEALDALGHIIDSMSVDVSTPNGVNEGRFMGFEHESADIYAFRFRARFGVLDDLRWARDGRGIIPAPSSLVSLGVVFLGCVGRRRRSP